MALAYLFSSSNHNLKRGQMEKQVVVPLFPTVSHWIDINCHMGKTGSPQICFIFPLTKSQAFYSEGSPSAIRASTMGEFAPTSFAPWQHIVLLGQFSRAKWGEKLNKQERRRHASLVKNHMSAKPATYFSRITTDVPLYESPGASFDQYLEDKPRVFKAIFPDKRRSQQINEEEWRILMLPIQFLFLTVSPVVDMRLQCKSKGKNYPAGVPEHVTKVLELDITRWELQGLDSVVEPSHFTLGVKGALYPDRLGKFSRLKGKLEMKISFVLPPVLALIPEDLRKSVAESVLSRLVENMKHKVNGSLLADYTEFKRGRPRTLA